jgi:proline iminopeptidase
MTAYLSKLDAHEWRHGEAPLRASGYLTVSRAPLHELYWAEYGNPNGQPVLFVHGGPGGGTDPSMTRLFDAARYRIVLFDQRGSGHSRPSAAHDPIAALTDNTTPHLIADMCALCEHLNIREPAIVFGGSWGSTLALAFAIAQPERVARLVLRGIFLCRRKDVDYFYQGNAAGYARAPYDTQKPGAYLHFPEAWSAFVEVIPEAERGDMVAAYARIFALATGTPEEAALQNAAAIAWSVWEGTTSYLAQDMAQIGKFADAEFARAFARIENHYFMNGAFLGGSGEQNRDQSYLLEHIARITHIPVHIVHGRYDVVCPLFQAEELVKALVDAGAPRPDYRITAAGHSLRERENHRALADIMDELPRR